MTNRKFIERLNKELDNMGMPEPSLERIDALSKLLKIPKFKAEALLSGHASPNDASVIALAKELEVDVNWLLET